MSTSTDTVSPFSEPVALLPRELLAPGVVVAGRYEIRAILGSGGYAVVYRAFDRELRGEIALKLLRSDRLGNAARIRFRREARATRQAGSPYLVRIFDIHAEDPLFLTMELVGGGSVRDRIEAGRLPVDEAVRIAIQALEGLKALHTLGIIHRDVKPENLLLTREGQVKLADFGLALPWEPDQSRATQAGALIGTLDYMAPEQAMGDPVDGRTDLYSLGLVLLEMIAGRRPRRDRQGLGRLMERLRDDKPLARDLPGETPPWLVDALERMLARDPRRRYPSAEVALQALCESRRARFRQRWRPGARDWLGLGLTLLAAASVAVMFHPRRPAPSLTLVRAGDTGAHAIDATGHEVWSRADLRPGMQVAMARLEPDQPPSPVAIVAPTDRPNAVERQVLSILDPHTGRFLRGLGLQGYEKWFTGFSDVFGSEVRVVDLDRDGVDEVLVSYFHEFWPSYTVLYESRVQRSRVLLVASGHHRPSAYQDVDGDGRPEILFTGINNRMGWYNAVAAVRIQPWIKEASGDRFDSLRGSTPDEEYLGSSAAAIAWYALAPPRRLVDQDALAVDTKHRTLTLQYKNGSPYALGFDGLPISARGHRSSEDRERARKETYRTLRVATWLVRLGMANAATVQVRGAVASAQQAEDPILEEWARRVEGRTLVRAGRIDEAEAIFRRLADHGSEAACEIAFDAAHALHLVGHLRRATGWYQEGLERGGPEGTGRGRYELLEGQVLALGELGEWESARRAVAAFANAFPANATQAHFYRAYLDWRTGNPPHPAELAADPSPMDLYRYWILELRRIWARRPVDLERILLGVRREEQLMSQPLTGLLASLEGEVLARLGRLPEALDLERQAVVAVGEQLHEDPIARAHYELVLDRYARLAHRLGKRDLSRSLVIERDRFRASRAAGD